MVNAGIPRSTHSCAAQGSHCEPRKVLFWHYREEKLRVRRRGGRERAIGTRAPMAASDSWSHDFLSDRLTDWRRLRFLTVVDDCTRKCLTLVADRSLSDLRVLDRQHVNEHCTDR
ncbi:putative transposase [Agrobacterium rubi TR3 = NBRC 13261]|uniref:Putative transposase n=1 Tax=Agrobacterium rubi TR3 = NBRC 13261 TaxID=1368415 RepID=A0A081D2Y4_9HYPH|nr:putative transposase [Agrobacterium rubi TR3 = NBRC 13261]